MPSGSKKRKSSKKPKPQGDPPELEAGLEGAMGNNEEEVFEATPSPKGIEGDLGAMAERGFQGNPENGEVPQEGDAEPDAPKENFQTDAAAPDQDFGDQGDPSSQAEPEPKENFQTDDAAPDQNFDNQGDPPLQAEIPAVIEAEAPGVLELEGETAQRETEPRIDTPLMELEGNTDAIPEETKPELETDAVPVELLEPVVDATPDAPPDEIRPDADIGLDEAELSKESTKPEREFELGAAPIGSDSGMDESLVETETKTDAASADIQPEIGKAPDEFKLEMDAAPAEVQPEIDEPLVKVQPEADAVPCIESETNEALDEVSVEPEREPAAAPAKIEPEAEVEELETAAPADNEPETKEAERELVTDTAPKDVEAEAEEGQVQELETAAPAVIEQETEGLMERELVTDASPTDVEAEVEEALAERESAIDAATAEAEPEMDAAPVDTTAERDTARADTDSFHDEVPPEIDAASLEIEAETDVAVCEFGPEADAAVVEFEPPTQVNPVEIEAETNEGPDEIRQDEGSQSEIEAAPEPEPEVEALAQGEPEANAEDVDNSAEIEAKMELPQETEPEPKPLDLPEDTNLEPLQEIEPESEAEAKPEDEALVGTKGEERESVEIESVEAPSQINSQPEVETIRGIELEAEAEVPLEAEPESEVEAPAEVEPDEKDLIEPESDMQDLVGIEPDQSDVKEHDQQPQQQGGEADSGELVSSVCEDNQPSEPQPQIASEVLVTEDEPPAISAADEANLMDDSTSSTSSSEASHDTDRERTLVEQEPEKGDDIPQSAITIEGEGESTAEVVSENQDTGATAVDNEQGAADELPAESKDFNEDQERAVDVGHDEDGTLVASSGSGGETEESREQELAIELPRADVVVVEESAKEDISEDGAVSASAGNGGGEAEVSSEQESGIEMPPADVVDVEELAKEEPTPSDDQEFVTKQTQQLIDEQELSLGLGADVDEPPSVESEQSLNATLPSSESEMTSDACEPQDEAVTLASEGNIASEQKLNFESATAEVERDIGEEEAASSTVAEVGSVLNDFDDRASFVQEELPTDLPTTYQDLDIPDCKEFDDISSTDEPESVEARSRDQLASEPSPAEKVDVNAVCGLTATSEQQEVLLESAAAAKPAGLHSAPVEETLSVEQLPSVPQPEQVFQDTGKDEVHSSKVVPANEEPRTDEEERAACEDDKVAADSILGTSFPFIAGDELNSKALTYLENGKQSMSRPEAPSNELVEQRDESSIHQSEANNMDKAEIHVMDSKELKEAECNLIEGDTTYNDTDKTLVESASPILEGRDMKGVQTFRQESTQEASLPVIIPAQDRALEHVNLKSTERPSEGGTLQRRTKLLDCCGMFDLLLRKT